MKSLASFDELTNSKLKAITEKDLRKIFGGGVENMDLETEVIEFIGHD